MDFPKLNGLAHCSSHNLKKLVATEFAVMSLQSLSLLQLLVATFFVLFLEVGSRGLMSSITTSFFAASSFSCRYPVSLSQLKLLPIPLILIATKFSVVT